LASKDGTIRLWDGATGDALGVVPAHASAVYAIDFSPDGLSLASASEDAKAILWRRESLAPSAAWTKVRELDVPLESLLRRPRARHAIAFSPDGSRLATASHDFRVCLWDAHTGDAVAPPLIRGPAPLN
jgi:WD40 repeat protein